MEGLIVTSALEIDHDDRVARCVEAMSWAGSSARRRDCCSSSSRCSSSSPPITRGGGCSRPDLAARSLCAAALDGSILRWRRGRWEFPDGAILSAMLVAMVLSAQQPWHYTAITAVVAILSKYLFRSRAANVFNPAAFALVATFYVFDTGQSWWGALPSAPPFAEACRPAHRRLHRRSRQQDAAGARRSSALTTRSLRPPRSSDPRRRVAEVFRTPDAQATLFFAVFILTDPPTSPVRYPRSDRLRRASSPP